MQILRPSLCLASVFDIDLDHLRSMGIRGMIVDLDNTVGLWDTAVPNPTLREWLSSVRQADLAVCLVSNGLKSRVDRFCHTLGVPGIANAGKPRRRSFLEAMRVMGTSRRETAVVGDQIFTDILGGNRLGLFTILVSPLGDREFAGTKMVRWVEALILRQLGIRRPLPDGEGLVMKR